MEGEIDGYRLLRELGRGGAGAVYLAQRPGETPVALKLLLASFSDERLEPRFRKEIQALEALNHPAIVRLRGAGAFRGRPYLVMDYVDGEPLSERLHRGGPMDPDRAAELVAELASALQHVHDRGLLHRDLKPANVLIDRDGRAYISDFGLSRDVDPRTSRLTHTGSFVGTPGYWPPEQALGLRDATSTPADIYGLGGILYACLTGRAPRPEKMHVDSLLSPIVPPHRLRSEVPRWLSLACMACLRSDPTQRTPSPAALALALQGPPARGVAHPAFALAGGVLAAAAVLGGAFFAFARPASPSAAPTIQPAAVATAKPPPRKPAPPVPAPATPTPPSAPSEASNQADEEAQALDRARRLSAVGDPTAALAVLQPLLDQGSERADLWWLAGQCRSNLGRFSEAYLDVERALALDPDLSGAWITAAHVLLKLNLAERALAAIERAVALSPDLPTAHYNHGRVLQQLGRNEEAVQAYARCLYLDPNDAGALTNRAVSLRVLGRTPEALSDLNATLSLEGNNPVALEQRASISLQAGRPAEALEDLTTALQIEPNPPALNWSNHGVALAQLGRFDEALTSLLQAVRLGERSPSTYWNLGNAYAKLGKVPEARQAFEEALTQLPPGALRQQVEAGLAGLPDEPR